MNCGCRLGWCRRTDRGFCKLQIDINGGSVGSLWFSVVSFGFILVFFFFQAEDGIRDTSVTGVQTCALPIFTDRSMRPRGGGAAHGAVGEHIRTRFGSYERFTREFKETASAQFGSGWLWLVWRDDALEILATSNAATPLVRGDTAILALDLWEHAYYLDHQNRRAAYVNAFLEELVDWDFANRTLANLAVSSDAPAARVRTVTETDRGRLSVR